MPQGAAGQASAWVSQCMLNGKDDTALRCSGGGYCCLRFSATRRHACKPGFAPCTKAVLHGTRRASLPVVPSGARQPCAPAAQLGQRLAARVVGDALAHVGPGAGGGDRRLGDACEAAHTPCRTVPHVDGLPAGAAAATATGGNPATLQRIIRTPTQQPTRAIPSAHRQSICCAVQAPTTNMPACSLLSCPLLPADDRTAPALPEKGWLMGQAGRQPGGEPCPAWAPPRAPSRPTTSSTCTPTHLPAAR